eukprot:EG_transcript_47936
MGHSPIVARWVVILIIVKLRQKSRGLGSIGVISFRHGGHVAAIQEGWGKISDRSQLQPAAGVHCEQCRGGCEHSATEGAGGILMDGFGSPEQTHTRGWKGRQCQNRWATVAQQVGSNV